MAVILTEHDLLTTSGLWRYWAYNATDCCETRVVHDVLINRVEADPDAARCYAFERAVQAPAMAMMQRGILIDEQARKAALKALEADEKLKIAELNRAASPHWTRTVQVEGKCGDEKPHKWSNAKVPQRQYAKALDCGIYALSDEYILDQVAFCLKCHCARTEADSFNPYSPDQVKELLYDKLGLPKQYEHKKHEVSVNDECLQKLIRKSGEFSDLIKSILECRKIRKQMGFLNSRPDPDGRWRASFNVGATEVDRWSSSKSPFGTGTNFQNVADRSRNIFVADPGMWLFYADLGQAESNVVAFDAEDEDYIIAHNGNDVHTFVAMQCWPELDWPGWETGVQCDKPWHKNQKPHEYNNKCLAEKPTDFDPHHDYRLYAKKVQHGGNIGMSAVGVARELGISQTIAQQALDRLDKAFPRRKARQREIINEVRTTGAVRTFLGRRRQFFERLYDSGTHREALAQTQQSSIGWLLNMALYRVWHAMDTCIHLDRAPSISDPNRVWLLAQVHDAILGEVRAGDFEALREVKRLMSIPMPIRGRVCRIPVDVAYGPNWRHSDMTKLED